MPEETAVVETKETPTEGQEPDIAAEVEADLAKLDETDPQRRLAKAVEADLAELGSEGSTEEGGEAKELGQAPAGTKEFEEEKSRLALVLKKRNEVQKERDEARQEAEQIRSEAMRMKHEADAYVAQVKQQAAQVRQFINTLRTNPAEALRMAGIDPEEFLFGIAKEGTPEGAQARELQELRRKTAEFEQWQKRQEMERRRQQEEAARQQQTAFRKQVETSFINMAKTKSESIKSAVEAGLLSEHALITEGDRIADQYREVTGQEASLEDIIEYIDERVSKAYNRIKGTHQAPVPSPVSKPAPSAKPGKKTLTSEDAGVRTALKPSPNPEETEEERRERAARAVKLVMDKARARGAEE